MTRRPGRGGRRSAKSAAEVVAANGLPLPGRSDDGAWHVPLFAVETSRGAAAGSSRRGAQKARVQLACRGLECRILTETIVAGRKKSRAEIAPLTCPPKFSPAKSLQSA